MTAARRRQYGTGSIFQRADGKWVGRAEAGWNAAGGRRRIVVTAATEAEAKRRLRDRLRARDDGADGTASRLTVKAWSERWLEHKRHAVRPKTWAGYQSAIRQHVVPTIGHKRLDGLTPGDVRSVADAARKAGRSSTTAKHAHVVLVDMLRAAQREGFAVPPRVLLVDAPAKAAHDRDAIPVTDALALLKVAATQSAGSRWVAALLQGMRQGECLGLTWDLVDLEAGTIDVSWQLQAVPFEHGCETPCGRRFGGDCPARRHRIPDGYEIRPLDGALSLVRPKTAKGRRIVPLIPWMRDALHVWHTRAPVSPHGLVWPRPDGRPRLAKVDAGEWADLQELADVQHPRAGRRYVLHEARHTTATLLAEAGVDPSVIQAILGHSSVATQQGYKHVRLDRVRDALGAVAERLELT